jgi:phosphopantetheinyl transferase (holo-ACP synthase)
MIRTLARIATAVAFALPVAAGAQSGGFLVMLGADTVAIERFERTPARIEGSLLRRIPQTYIIRYVVGLNADGTVASYSQEQVLPDGSPRPNAPTGLKMAFTGDSVVRTVMRNNQPAELRSAAPKGTLPGMGASWLGMQLQIDAARKGGEVNTIGFSPTQAAPAKATIRLIGKDSAEIVSQGFRTGFRLDKNGQIMRGDGTLTTEKLIATPLKNPDIATLATAWGAKDASGKAMGPASPRDTVLATVGTANIWIDYGRPAKRGREIWGKLVPLDTTWRLGANAATQFRTDKDLEIGGVTIKAGLYTLFLYPQASQAFLIVNSQTGQWGTDHDGTKDVARIPLESHMKLPTSEERFRIFVAGDMLMMHWDKGGYGVKLVSK